MRPFNMNVSIYCIVVVGGQIPKAGHRPNFGGAQGRGATITMLPHLSRCREKEIIILEILAMMWLTIILIVMDIFKVITPRRLIPTITTITITAIFRPMPRYNPSNGLWHNFGPSE